MFLKKKKKASISNNSINNDILILGSGCKKCNELERVVSEAQKELNLNYSIGHVTDYAEIVSFGVMSTPAFVLKGKVLSSGKVLTIEEAKNLIKKETNIE